LTILKLGGSVVTEKGALLTPNMPAIRRLAREVSDAGVSPLILVHGGAKRIIMGVDVDGLYTEDPKINPSARLIRHLTLKDLEKVWGGIGGSSSTDVTGGMMGKILELIPPIKHGAKALIVNALKPGNVYSALKGELVGTEITKE